MNKKNCEVRSAEILLDDSGMVSGYASVFNKWSNPLQGKLNGQPVVFREMILPGAFDGLIDTQDVTANFQHEDENGILARRKNGVGSLHLEIDEFGLKYSFEMPDTTLGKDTRESLKRGDVDSSSFAFIVAQGGEQWRRLPDGTYERTVSKIGKLLDVSIVVRPAYEEASVSIRGLEQFIQEETEIELQDYLLNLKTALNG